MQALHFGGAFLFVAYYVRAFACSFPCIGGSTGNPPSSGVLPCQLRGFCRILPALSWNHSERITMNVTNEQRTAVRWLLLEGLTVASIVRRTGYGRDVVERVRGEDLRKVRIGGRWGNAVHPNTGHVVPTIPAQVLADEVRRIGSSAKVAHIYGVPRHVVTGIVHRLG